MMLLAWKKRAARQRRGPSSTSLDQQLVDSCIRTQKKITIRNTGIIATDCRLSTSIGAPWYCIKGFVTLEEGSWGFMEQRSIENVFLESARSFLAKNGSNCNAIYINVDFRRTIKIMIQFPSTQAGYSGRMTIIQ